MVFGYNTEIRLGDTLYHVQSEARGCEPLLETQVFVKGRCISKRSIQAGSDENLQAVQESLRLQHRSVVDCIRAGQLDVAPVGPPTAPATDEPDPTPPAVAEPETSDRNFTLRCISARREAAELVLGFQVTRASSPVGNLKLRCSLIRPDSELPPELIAEPVTDHEGKAPLKIDGVLAANAELQVEMEDEGKTSLRRFRLRQRQNR